VLMIAIAPELDLRYERLFAYLHDDVTRRRPSVDLACSLLCHSARERLDARAHFAADAPLLSHGLLELIEDPSQPRQPLIARVMKPDEQIVRFVIGESSLDTRLAPCARVEHRRIELASLPLEPETSCALPNRIGAAEAFTGPRRLAFHGPQDAGQYLVAVALATAANTALLAVDLDRAADSSTGAEDAVALAFREAHLHGYALFITGVDRIAGDPGSVHAGLIRELAATPVLTMVETRQVWAPAAGSLDGRLGLVRVPFPAPTTATRRACWKDALAACDLGVSDEVVDTLAENYRLDALHIAEAAHGVCNRA
jgi:hypothetical protein